MGVLLGCVRKELLGMTKKKKFAVGMRVRLDPPQPGAFAQKHGQVVYWHGKHNPRYPRVRWDSHWGTTCKAEHLRELTDEEKATLPPVQLVDGYDTKYDGKKTK
jgi:hypothetical protein